MLKVVCRCPQSRCRIIEESETSIAQLAQKTSHFPSAMIMVNRIVLLGRTQASCWSSQQ